MSGMMSKRQQARNEKALQDLVQNVPGNNMCADCHARNPGMLQTRNEAHRGPGMQQTKFKFANMNCYLSLGILECTLPPVYRSSSKS